MLTRRSFLAIIPASLALPHAALAGTDPVYAGWTGNAVDGTDVVAYFTEGKPVGGQPEDYT